MSTCRLISSLAALILLGADIGGQTTNAPRLSIVIASGNQGVRIAWPSNTKEYVLEQTAQLNSAWQQTPSLPSTENGQFVLTLAPTNTTRFFRMRRVENIFDFRVVSHNPANGASEVGVTYRPQIFFSKPAHSGTLSTNSIYAMAGGRVLGANIVPASDGSFAWIFFKEPMPGATRVRVIVDGSLIAAAGGTPQLDGDGDGRPGGQFSYEFTTVSVADLSNTSLSGIVVDPGPDMVPRTADDLDPGPDSRLGTPDDVFTIPIQGAKVFLLGRETSVITTGADGRFRFSSVPNGNVKIVVDGTTALRPPANGYFPEMVLDAQMILGKENWSMTNGPEIYLPRVSKNILQTVNSRTNTTVVKTTEEGAMGLSAFERSLLTVEVAPNSLVSSSGQVMTNGGQVGISTVPAEVVRDMLPPGVLQHTFDITVQAPGVATLAAPAPMTFPNVFNQPPGTKLNFLSFDHTTGRLVIEGTATVSEDGTMVRTDPGTGITHPGWHGLTPPGGPNDPPCNPTIAPDTFVPGDPVSAGLTDYLLKSDEQGFVLSFGNAAARMNANEAPCSAANVRATPIVVDLIVDDPKLAAQFVDLKSQRIRLLPGEKRDIYVKALPLADKLLPDADEFFGVNLIVDVYQEDTAGGRRRVQSIDDISGGKVTPPLSLFIYRYVDRGDADHSDGLISFPGALADGTGKVTRKRSLKRQLSRGAFNTRLELADHSQFEAFTDLLVFDPQTIFASIKQPLRVFTPAGREIAPGTLTLEGEGTSKHALFFNKATLIQRFEEIINNASPQDVALEVPADIPAGQIARFSLSFNGQSTPPLAIFGSTPDDVKAALEALPGLGPGNIEVTAQSPNVLSRTFHVKFINALAGKSLPLLQVQPSGPEGIMAVVQNVVAFPFITAGERALFDTAAKRNDFADTLEKAIMFRFADFSEGFQLASGPGPRTVGINWNFSRQSAGRGSAWGRSPDKSIKEMWKKLAELATTHENYTATAQYYQLAQSYDQREGAMTDVFVNSILEERLAAPIEQNFNIFLNNLTAVAAHETGHTLGLHHVAKNQIVTVSNEKQMISLSGSAGSYRLNFAGSITESIPANSDGAVVQSALAKLPNIGSAISIAVTGPAGGPFTVEFKGVYTASDVPELTATDARGVTVSISTTAEGDTRIIPDKEIIVPGAMHGTDDIMATGSLDVSGISTFLPHFSRENLLLSFKMGWTPEDAIRAMSFLLSWSTREIERSLDDAPLAPESLIKGPQLALLLDGGIAPPSLQFKDVDEVVTQPETQTIQLLNFGDEPLTVRSVRIEESESPFRLNAFTNTPFTLAPHTETNLTVSFQPSSPGRFSGRLLIESSDGTKAREMLLNGRAISLGPHLELTSSDNNLGGVPVGGLLTVSNLISINNTGLAPLRITQIQLSETTAYTLVGLPNTFAAANPLILAAGQSIAFGLRLAPTTPGIGRVTVSITSDDPLAKTTKSSFTATVLARSGNPLDSLHYGQDYAAIESPDFPDGPVLRAKSDENGKFEFFLPPEQRYHGVIFDPVSGLVAHLYGITAKSGENTQFGTPVFLPSTAPDTDGDGLPDDVEFAIGSNPNKVDSDGNGLDDFVEVAQGRDPLGDQLAVTGLVGKVEMFSAGTVTLYSPLKETPNTLHSYVGDGAQLKVVDLTRPTVPVVLAATNAPGNVQDIAIDPLTETAVVAAFRLALVNISKPASPEIIANIAFEAVEVEALNGYAYAVKLAGNDPSASMRVIDLVSRTLLNSLSLPVRLVGDMVREANALYVLGEESLMVVTVEGTNMTLRATLPMKGATGRMAVAGGILYVPFAGPDGSAVTTGYSTVDVSNPDAPRLIAGPQAPPNVARAPVMAVNGSGTGLMLGGSLEVLNVSNPTNTYSFITRYDIPPGGFGSGIEIGGGLAVVADSTGGLLLYNFAAADVKGQPPVIGDLQIQPDGDINTLGLQLVEGRPFYVTASLQDDVQVRSVELLVDGVVAQRSISAPFVLSAIAPQLAQRTNLVVQLRATDSGGNVGLSTPVQLPIIFDPVLPVLVQMDPNEGETKGRGYAQARLVFSKPMGGTTTNVQRYELRKTTGEIIPITSAILREGDRVAAINFPRLEAGSYQFVAHSALIKDRAGNALAGTNVIRNFAVDPYSIRWKTVSGQRESWFAATNWVPERVPGPEDTVLIDIPNTNVLVVMSAPTEWQLAALYYPVSVRSLESKEPLALAWVEFKAEERFQVDSTLFGFAAKLVNTRWLGGDACTIYTAGDMELIGVTMEGDFHVDDKGVPFSPYQPGGAFFVARDSLTLNGNFLVSLNDSGDNISGIKMPYTGSLLGSGTLSNMNFFAAAKQFEADAEPLNEEITIGPGITFRGVQGIGVSGIGNRLVNRGSIIYDRPYSASDSNTRQHFYLEGLFTNSVEFINYGNFEVRNGTWLSIDGPYLNRFFNRGTLKVTDGGYLQLGAYINSPQIICEATAICQLTGVLITEPGQVTLLSGDGRWLVSGASQLAGSTQIPVRLLQDPVPGLTNALAPTQGIVRLSNGATLEGSTTFNDITFEGELHNYDFNSRTNLPRYVNSYSGDVVVRTNLTLNGSIFFHRSPSISTVARMLWAGGKQRLLGQGRIVFERALYTGQFAGLGTDLTIGPGITIDGDGVTLGESGRIQGFPYPFIHNQGTILAEKAGSIVNLNVITFTNSGTIRIGSGVTVTNFYGFENTSSGSVVISAAGTQAGVSHGQLRILGDVVLNGKVALEADGGFRPTAPSSFELVTYRTRTGEFSSVVPPPASQGANWSSEYAPNSFYLKLSSGGTPVSGFGANVTESNGALLLNGGQQWGEVTHAPDLSAYPLTIMAWVKTSDRGPEQRGIVSKWSDEVPIGYAVYVQGGEIHALYAQNLAIGVPAASGSALNGGLVADGAWHHIAFVVDNLGGILYVDGAPKAEAGWNSDTRQESVLAGPTISVLPVFLGAIANKGYGFKGELDEISISRAALTHEQIDSYKAQRLSPRDSDSIIGIWHFDEMSGTVTEDSSGHSHDALLKGGALFSTSRLP